MRSPCEQLILSIGSKPGGDDLPACPRERSGAGENAIEACIVRGGTSIGLSHSRSARFTKRISAVLEAASFSPLVIIPISQATQATLRKDFIRGFLIAIERSGVFPRMLVGHILVRLRAG
jgi:hypothetical protein